MTTPKVYFVDCNADGSNWSFISTMDSLVKRLAEELDWTVQEVKDCIEKDKGQWNCTTKIAHIDLEQAHVTIFEITEGKDENSNL